MVGEALLQRLDGWTEQTDFIHRFTDSRRCVLIRKWKRRSMLYKRRYCADSSKARASWQKITLKFWRWVHLHWPHCWQVRAPLVGVGGEGPMIEDSSDVTCHWTLTIIKCSGGDRKIEERRFWRHRWWLNCVSSQCQSAPRMNCLQSRSLFRGPPTGYKEVNRWVSSFH